jgi:HTH-type transcriptional regulator/antitoxin HigA
MYSKARINQFANRIKMHPGIIVGQLHHRGEVRAAAHRGLLVKIREHVLTTAIVDGWGCSTGMI